MPDWLAQWVEELKTKPWIAHLLRMQERFTQRLGNQFAAAVTYFSVLSIVPVLLFAFSMLGMVLTVFRPDLLDAVSDLIKFQFQNNPLGDQVIAVMERALAGWATLSIVSLFIFAWSGAAWMANLKSAIRAQMRTDFSEGEKKGNIVVETLTNLGTLLVVLLTILIMFALAAVATSLSEVVLGYLNLTDSGWAKFVVYTAPIPVSIAVGFALFAFLYRISFQQRVAKRIWLGGASVFSGYLGCPDLTAATLVPDPTGTRRGLGVLTHDRGRLATGLLDVTSDLSALDSSGFWAVVVSFEGDAVCARFDHIRAATPWAGPPWHGPTPDAWRTSLDQSAFEAGVREIREVIAAGGVYQVNLTRRLSAPADPGMSIPALGAALAK